MDPCLCKELCRLSEDNDEAQARELIPALNKHLKDLHCFLARFKVLARDVHYQIKPNNHRSAKLLLLGPVNLAPVDQVCTRFQENPNAFWTTPYQDPVHTELRRRLACVVIFLRSKLDANAPAPTAIAALFRGHQNYLDIRQAGRKYYKISQRLGGIGSLFWLPLDIPSSTYERYLHADDDEAFNHLKDLEPRPDLYHGLVQTLVLNQVCNGSPLAYSHYNLISNYSDIIPASDHLRLIVYAFGGSVVPDTLLKALRSPRRRWNKEGEIVCTSAAELDFPSALINSSSNDEWLGQEPASLDIIKDLLDDDSVVWSLSPELIDKFSHSLQPQTRHDLEGIALRMICFACPPCYEGNIDWSPSLKKVIWSLLEKIFKVQTVTSSIKSEVLDVMLFFSERDTVAIRQKAIGKAKGLLRKSMPYYLHASVALFQSILCRLEGDFAGSEAHIRDFLWRGPQPVTRRDHALRGRLHISQIETKIRCYDKDVASYVYKWEAEQPFSSLDIEVTSRLQNVAARFFQSVGDFGAARASLEQFLFLNTTKPIRANTRRLVVARLADIYCELADYDKAVVVVQPEIEELSEVDRQRRFSRRLILTLVEANVGLLRLSAAEGLFNDLDSVMPRQLDDMYDQQLHMRRLIAAARIAHLSQDREEALRRWNVALQEVEQMYALKSKTGFTAAVIYLSRAHAQLITGDKDGARQSWATGSDILRHEQCEFWIPVVATRWMHKIATEVHELQGWTLRMMLPGGKPDVAWP